MSEDWRAEVDAWGLLVVPSDALRGMLDEGPCGFRPPMAWMNGPRWVFGWASERAHVRALVLRWEGQDMPHGWLAAGLAAGMPWQCVAATDSILECLREAGCTIISVELRLVCLHLKAADER